MDSPWTRKNIASLDGSCYKAIESWISQNSFSYIKIFSVQCRKNITDEINKKRIHIANFINVYTNIYTYNLSDVMTQNKNDSINSILQHRQVFDKNCCVVFPTSRFPYLIFCLWQCKWKAAATCLAIGTKSN